MPEWDAATAEWYASNYGDYPTNRLAVDLLDLPPAPVVVDVGCGTGAALRHAASKCGAGLFVGVDPVPRMIEIAREQTAAHPQSALIEFRAGSAASLPVADDFADFVFAFDSADHWADVVEGLAEIGRALRPQGRLAIVKDGGVPGAGKARQTLAGALERAGFLVEATREVDDGDVRFSLWICKLKHAS